MSERRLTVAMDEAGNTGENLLDRQQPVYALAAVRVPQEDAAQTVAAALSRTQMSELKFSRLARSGPGRRNLLQLIAELNLTPNTAAVAVVHKPSMVAFKLVDELVEPRMLQQGQQMEWYSSGDARDMAYAFADRAPRALGELYDELAAAFIAVVRDYTEEAAEALQRALQRARIVSRDEVVSAVLALMIDSDEELREEFESRDDALDPAVPSLFWQSGHWSHRLGADFDVLHDDSNTIARWAAVFEVNRRRVEAERQSGASPAPRSVALGEITIDFPDAMASITFGQSERDELLQVADVLAGAAAYLYSVGVGLRPPDTFARELHRARVDALIQHEVGPRVDARLLPAHR